LRVTNALFEAAPKGYLPRLLKTKDAGASSLHRFTSIHPLARSFLEWSQNGAPEEFFTRVYRFSLRRGGAQLKEELKTLLEQEFKVVKTAVVVATHFGLAHEIAGAKAELEHELGVKIVLVVCVTDDSPQKLWYVEGADYIYVPSEQTKQTLLSYGTSAGFAPVEIEVISYPVNPRLTKKLTEQEWSDRLQQLDPAISERIHISVPISGAAVDLEYLDEVMTNLARRDPRFHFYIVCRENMYTADFIKRMGRRAHVSLITSKHDREIVRFYTELLSTTVFSLEITKPSEQAFKALITPKRKGGMTLLFSKPVGRQEYDNLSFLKRHSLLGTRSFMLPDSAAKAAQMIMHMYTDKVFLQMTKRKYRTKANETSFLGAKQFWKKLLPRVFAKI